MVLAVDAPARRLQGVAQLLDALTVIQDAVAQPGAEHLLHVGKALEAQRLGAQFRFHTTVRSVTPGTPAQLLHEYTPPTEQPGPSTRYGDAGGDTRPAPAGPQARSAAPPPASLLPPPSSLLHAAPASVNAVTAASITARTDDR